MTKGGLSSSSKNGTVVHENVTIEPAIVIGQAAFPLTEIDYEHLKKSLSTVNAYVSGIMVLGLGMLIPPSVKQIISLSTGQSLTVEAWEWWTAGIAIMLGIGIGSFGMLIGNKKGKLIRKEIEDHFSNSPKKKTVLGGDNE